jgi:uncharacterized protein (DUF1501 family)
MSKKLTSDPSRRLFLKTASSVSALGAGAPVALNLAGIQAAAAQTAGDYRALVCVFLFGGNDQTSTLVPFDTTEFAAIRAARTNIGRPATDFVSIGTVASQGGRPFALAKELAPLATLYGQGRAAILANVGPMYAPLDKPQYLANSAAVPPRLFSHNDQQSVWQSSGAEGTTVGWGGRFGDLLGSANTNTIFTSVSVASAAVFLYGNQIQQYQVSSSGPSEIWPLQWLYGSGQAAAALRQIVTAGSTQPFQSHLAGVTNRALSANETLKTALSAAPALATAFTAANPLAQQLKLVARMISARQALGMKRQVFFVGLGGFDHHSDIVAKLPVLHTQVADAVASFYAATVELGVAQQVTTFTASDFGRTLTSNGDGSDHGWGGHHFIVGGAVKGGSIYGSYPTVALRTPEDVGSGRLLPSTSTTQLAATLGTWFGVPAGSLADALPHIDNFTVKNLGLFV